MVADIGNGSDLGRIYCGSVIWAFLWKPEPFAKKVSKTSYLYINSFEHYIVHTLFCSLPTAKIESPS